MIDSIKAKQYKIVKKLGQGAFGEVFKAVNIKNNMEVAIKLENSEVKNPQLFYQAKIISYLHADQIQDLGIPRMYATCSEDNSNIMVMDLLGPSLEDLFVLCQKKFDLKTVLMAAIQMIQRIEFMHNKDVIHRDIKPDNFVIGYGSKGYKIYIIDFGLAKKFVNKDGSHIAYKDNKNLTGTARYASLNTHLGIQQSRRDDLECIAHVLIYFLKGSLPWQNLRANNKKQKYEKILDKKLSYTLQKLCLDIPNQFQQMLRYSRCLQFEDKPDYEYLKGLFKKLMQKQQMKMDYEYCWGSLRKQQYSFTDQSMDKVIRVNQQIKQ